MMLLEHVLAYTIFFATAAMGYGGVAWWAVAAPVLLLAALRYDDHVCLARRHEVSRQQRALAILVGASIVHGTAFAVLAFAAGRAVALMGP